MKNLGTGGHAMRQAQMTGFRSALFLALFLGVGCVLQVAHAADEAAKPDETKL